MDKIFKNSAWLLSAQVITKIISFFYSIFLAGSLGVENFGLYVAAGSYFSLISSIADFGIGRFLTREISKDPSKAATLLPSTIFLRFTISITFFIIFAFGITIFDPEAIRRNLSILALLAVLPQSISMTLDATFIALSKVRFSAIGFLILSFLTTITGFLLVSFGYGPFGAVAALAFGQLLYAIFLVLMTIFQKIDWQGGVNLKLLKSILIGSLPYGFLAIMGLIYFKIDSLILSYLRGNFETGIYGMAYKFLEAIVFLPATLAVILFPVLAKLHETDFSEIKNFYPKIIKIMALLGFLVMLGYIFIIPVLIKLFLPKFSLSVLAVQILALSIPFMFIHVPLAQVILSTNRYLKSVIILSLIPLLFNIILNFALVPFFGYIAAAWITVASDIVSLLVLYIFIRKNFS